MIALLVIGVFLGTFLTVALAVLLINATRRDVPETAQDAGPVLLQREPMSTMPGWRQILVRLDFADHLRNQIAAAGLHWSVGRVTLAMLLLGSFFLAIFLDAPWSPPGGALVAAWVGGYLPYAWIEHKRKKRMRQIQAQFPDALDSLARAMRAGHPLSGAIALLAAESPAPLGPEFRKTADEHRLGLAWDVALPNLARRLPTLDIRVFVAAVLLQLRTGGRVTEVLERLAETIREGSALRGEVQAISAQARLTGNILTALPILIAVTMYCTNPGYLTLLVNHPTGRLLLWAAAGCLVLGHLAIQRIIDIKAPN